ncbi:hypothetical protein [Rufibacter quisquiliarum]|uniref:Uncharacterized protein n=1 Tax=Rufibacter quisquiliarum TaxID=1549639 RepID=A0A839GH08_9BACT|nr:hypothetical protein [Rufibacter quisquiliarum]MBA9078944.1 hypothetical protein [Rufibacter quisquiliarum]
MAKEYFDSNPEVDVLYATGHDANFFLPSRKDYAELNAKRGNVEVEEITRKEVEEPAKPETQAKAPATKEKAPKVPATPKKSKGKAATTEAPASTGSATDSQPNPEAE